MKTGLLVRHPKCYPTESLTGYVLRLSEVNGFITPWSLCQFAGLRQSETRTTGFPIANLAAITNRTIEELDSIAYTSPRAQPRWARLLNQPILPTELSILSHGFCPQCVVEKGFIEAHWHLRLMTACTVHLRPVLVKCLRCSRKVSWFRPGLLECQCGSSLLCESDTTITAQELSFLAVVRGKVISDSGAKECQAGLPVPDLASMDLRSLIAMARTLAKFRLFADGSKATDNPLQVVLAATRVLARWPANFFQLLNDLGNKSEMACRHGAAGKQFEGIYRTLFRTKAFKDRQIGFMRAAFIEFVTDHWGRGFVDRKMMNGGGSTRPSRYVTLAEYSKRLGVQPRTAQRILTTRHGVAERVKCGNSFRTIVDAQSGSIPAKAPGCVLRLRTASRTLKLPVITLRELRASGVFEVKHLPPGHPGWHEADIQAFTAKLLKATMSNADPCRNTSDQFSLSRVMDHRHLAPTVKAALITGLLAGSIAVSGSVDGTISGIQLDSGEYKRFLIDVRSRTGDNSSTPTEVAVLLHCDPGTVSGLFDRGFLKGRRTPVGLRIDNDSVKRFASEYASLASCAKAYGTSTRALMEKCRAAQMELLLVSVRYRKAAQPFARRADLGRLLPVTA